MSVTIRWRSASDQGKAFEGGTPDMLEVLKQTVGTTIGPNDVDTLRAMARTSGLKFYDEVADTIDAIGEIEVWGEW
jgi:hypothetical protein